MYALLGFIGGAAAACMLFIAAYLVGYQAGQEERRRTDFVEHAPITPADTVPPVHAIYKYDPR